jgi:hypothetical protein
MANRDQIIAALRASSIALDDDELSRRCGIVPRQTVNMICRRLAADGLITRTPGANGKLVNVVNEARSSRAMPPSHSSVVAPDPPAGSSEEQRLAERVMLDALGDRLGVRLDPRRLDHPDGGRVEIDGADAALSILVECWAHQGAAKVAQKYKLVNDATKLWWIAQALPQKPARLVICVSDEAAVRHLSGRSWQAAAIRDLGVGLEVVELPAGWAERLVDAQRRQFR